MGNPTLTVVTAHGGAESDGSTSLVGHMYYTLNDGNGNISSYGFAPQSEHSTSGPGKVFTNDNQNYSGLTYSTTTTSLAPAQYSTLQQFGQNPSAFGFNLKGGFKFEAQRALKIDGTPLKVF